MKLLISTFIAATSIGAHAATSFTENFSSNTLGPNMVVTDDQGDPSNIDTSGGNVSFPNPNGSGVERAYVGTVDVDYHTVDFSAEVTLIAADTGQAWFGLGAGGTANLGDGPNGGATFGEPGEGPVTYLRHLAGTGNLTLGTIANGMSGLNEPVNTNNATLLGAATYQLRLDYSAGAGTATYFVDNVQFGPAIDVSTYDFTGNGHVFFGGSVGTVMDDFSVNVIPEPSSIAVGGLGLLGLFLRRRR